MAGVLRALVLEGTRAVRWLPPQQGLPHDLDRPIYFPDTDALIRCLEEIRQTDWGGTATVSDGRQGGPQFQTAAEFIASTPAPIRQLNFLCGQFNLHLKNSGLASTTPGALNGEYYDRVSQLIELVRKHTKPMPYWRLLLRLPCPAVLDMNAEAAGRDRRGKRDVWFTVLGGAAVSFGLLIVQKIIG